MEKIEYKIEKNKEIIGQRYETYTIQKNITYDNGKTETRYRVFIPFRDGDINKIDLDMLDFPKPITKEEWEKLSSEYQKAWIRGTMTKELSEEFENLRLKEGIG